MGLGVGNNWGLGDLTLSLTLTLILTLTLTLNLTREARDRHSVLQVAAPHEVDKHGRDMEDPFRLRDMQTCQVRRELTCAPPHYFPLTPESSLLTPYYPLLTDH